MTELALEIDVEGDRDDVEVLLRALAPEQRDEFPGVEASLARTSETSARLTISGASVPSVRAATNAHLSWIRTIQQVLAVGGDPPNTEVL